jgi:hypothetical protein
MLLLHHRHRDDDSVVEVHTSSARPALLVGAAMGSAGIVVGCYALVRVGLNTNDFSRPAARVLNIEHTPLLALCEVSFGAVMILAAMAPRLGRIAIGLLSATLAGFGAALLAAAPTSRLHHWFGVVHQQGWSFVIVATIGLLTTLAFPTVTRQTVVRSGPDTPPNPLGTDRTPPILAASHDTSAAECRAIDHPTDETAPLTPSGGLASEAPPVWERRLLRAHQLGS